MGFVKTIRTRRCATESCILNDDKDYDFVEAFDEVYLHR